jgi:hypothetical protein
MVQTGLFFFVYLSIISFVSYSITLLIINLITIIQDHKKWKLFSHYFSSNIAETLEDHQEDSTPKYKTNKQIKSFISLISKSMKQIKHTPIENADTIHYKLEESLAIQRNLILRPYLISINTISFSSSMILIMSAVIALLSLDVMFNNHLNMMRQSFLMTNWHLIIFIVICHIVLKTLNFSLQGKVDTYSHYIEILEKTAIAYCEHQSYIKPQRNIRIEKRIEGRIARSLQ